MTTPRQMTDHPSINHPTYFLQSSFSPDGRALLFTSYRSGSPQFYETGFPTGDLRQLTHGPAVHPFSAAYFNDNERIVFTRGDALYVLHRATLEERLVMRLERASIGESSLSADGEWLVAAAKRDGVHSLITGRVDGRDWRIIEVPRTVIHPQFHPQDPEWIEFAHDPAPRMHRIRRDGTDLECLYTHGNDEFVVHETFLGFTGDLVYVEWPKSLWRLNWHTRERTKIADFNAWHIAPDHAGRRILCDTNHPDRGICLIDAVTGAVRPVCLSLSSNQGSQWRKSSYASHEDFAAAQALSWMEAASDTIYGPQHTHPHPSWSRDERHIAFASDRTGHTQVYVTEI